MPSHTLNRRMFLSGTAAAAAAAALPQSQANAAAGKPALCIFSKHLQWLNYKGMAEAAAELGFDGVELTVRRGGHVSPERADDQLPRAIETIRKAGIDVPGMATDITDPDNPSTDEVLSIASRYKIGFYRLGYLHYQESSGILEQLSALQPQMEDLAAINRRYRIFGGYHNHTGNYVGGSLWDTWELFKELDPQWIGFQYDTGNGYSEGVEGTWRTNARLVLPRAKMLAVKTAAEWADPDWMSSKPGRDNPWKVLTREDFLWYFRLLKSVNFTGPVSLHYEFPFSGVDTGARELHGITRQEVFQTLRHNLQVLRGMMQEAELL